MDLEDIKNTWDEMSEIRSKDSFLDEEIIRRITHEKSSSRLRRIILLESSGVLIAGLTLIYLIINFHKLDDWLNLLGGYGTLAILIISIALGIRLIREAASIDLINNSYKQTLENFTRFKKSLGLYKRVSIWLNFIFPFLLLPVVSKLWLDKNLLEDWVQFRDGLLTSFLLLPIILYVIFRFYRNTVSKVNKAFKDMEEENF